VFTGIIEGLGTLLGGQPAEGGRRIQVDAGFELAGTRIGDSIAVNGACLTVVSLSGTRFFADVSPETLARTTMGKLNSGARVNVERAMRLSDRIDGHLVSGHIDGTGAIKGRRTTGNAIVVTITADPALTRYMVEKGSVAVDGISLTLNTVDADSFCVSIIPHTAGLTTIGFRVPGDLVNIETDMIGKYVERFLRPNMPASSEREVQVSGIDRSFLAKAGFL
jgi:riboflavin synthase